MGPSGRVTMRGSRPAGGAVSVAGVEIKTIKVETLHNVTSTAVDSALPLTCRGLIRFSKSLQPATVYRNKVSLIRSGQRFLVRRKDQRWGLRPGSVINDEAPRRRTSVKAKMRHLGLSSSRNANNQDRGKILLLNLARYSWCAPLVLAIIIQKSLLKCSAKCKSCVSDAFK